MRAKRIAATYAAGEFASDIAVTDRSWWAAEFVRDASRDLGGRHTVTGEAPTSRTPIAARLTATCGRELVGDSIAVAVGRSEYSDFAGTLEFLDRAGHPLVYDVR